MNKDDLIKELNGLSSVYYPSITWAPISKIHDLLKINKIEFKERKSEYYRLSEQIQQMPDGKTREWFIKNLDGKPWMLTMITKFYELKEITKNTNERKWVYSFNYELKEKEQST